MHNLNYRLIEAVRDCEAVGKTLARQLIADSKNDNPHLNNHQILMLVQSFSDGFTAEFSAYKRIHYQLMDVQADIIAEKLKPLEPESLETSSFYGKVRQKLKGLKRVFNFMGCRKA